MAFPASVLRQPSWLVLLAALVLVGFIGWVDFATGWEWSFFVFYALPIALVVWKTERKLGFYFAFLCTATWGAAQFDSHPYHTEWGFVLAAASRLFYFVVLVVAASTVKNQQELDRARIESLELAQELERQILRTSEKEQQRIGRDLHDSLGPHLAAIGYAATFLAKDLRGRHEKEAAKADQIRELAVEAFSLTRSLARGIFPVQRDAGGLSIALNELAETTSNLTGMSVSFYETGNTHVLDPEDWMHLYRIVQEAVNNASRHGGATKVTIVLSKCENSLRLTVADNGRGMSPTTESGRGMGLHSMNYRAQALGGELKIDSNPSEGTIVSCEIPLHPHQSANTRS